MAANWSELLPELLADIGESIAVYEDFLSFGNVCRSWASVAETIRPTFSAPSRFPTLMLAEDEEEEDDSRRFYILSDKSIQKTELPEASKKQCFSSRGWLLTVDGIDVKLIEPGSRTQIELPKLNTLSNYDYHQCDSLVLPSMVFKFLISSQPHSNSNSNLNSDLFVFIIYGSINQLGFWKPGDASWTGPIDDDCDACFYDFIYHNGSLYLADYRGQVLVWKCNIHGLNPATFELIAGSAPGMPIGPNGNCIECLYIVTSGCYDDKLLVVSREGFMPEEEEEYDKEDMDYNTKAFQVFELDLKGCTWRKMEDLGDRALFVGFNSSFCKTGEVIESNCIYFTDDRYELYSCAPKGGGKDMGIYRMRDGSVEHCFGRESRSKLTPPIWIEPKLA